MSSRFWFDLFYLVLLFAIGVAAVVVIWLSKKRPLAHVIAVAMRSKTLWVRAEVLAVLLIVLAFAVFIVINNR